MSPRISISLLGAQTDQRLLALARDGHERAFEALVQRYRRPLLRYCRRIGLSEARAEDVLQQAFLQAWLALARGVEVRELRPWLYRIVHNAAVNAMRGRAESHAELTEAVQAGAALAGESNLERTIAVREALGEVAELPLMQRQAIFLTAVDGQTHDEVASALGISHGALRGLLYRARTTLRSAAAALTPPPLLEWAAGGGGTAGPAAERVAELTAGGGAVGFASVLLKGAAVAVTAGALATGAGVVASREHAAAPSQRGVSGEAPVASFGTPPDAAGRSLLGSGVSPLARLVEDRSSGKRGGEGRRRSRGASRRAHHGGANSGRDGSGGDEGRAEPNASSRAGDVSTDERGHDGRGGEANASDDGSGLSGGNGRGKPLEADPSGGGSGGSDLASGTAPSARGHGGASGGTSGGGSEGSGGSGASGSGAAGASPSGAEALATPDPEGSVKSGSSGEQSASAGERSEGGSDSSSGRGGAGTDG